MIMSLNTVLPNHIPNRQPEFLMNVMNVVSGKCRIVRHSIVSDPNQWMTDIETEIIIGQCLLLVEEVVFESTVILGLMPAFGHYLLTFHSEITIIQHGYTRCRE